MTASASDFAEKNETQIQSNVGMIFRNCIFVTPSSQALRAQA
tara:strand:- start:249 stop:374 length:126 start_codon:yes stop_codon:yes gene_type:complete